MRKLAVCYPGDMPFVFTEAAESLFNIEKPDGFEVRWFRGMGWCQARRRIHAAEKALAWGAELIACLDIDQIYEPDILRRLVSRIEEGYEMVAAMVPMRGYVALSKMRPFQPLAWTMRGDTWVPVERSDGEMVQCDFPTSATLIFRSSDLRKMRKPWYYSTYDAENMKMVHGEDGTFAVRMQRDAGIKAWVDTTIQVKHIGVFQIDDTFQERFSDWADAGSGPESLCNMSEKVRYKPNGVPGHALQRVG